MLELVSDRDGSCGSALRFTAAIVGAFALAA
jgi:hypothetical protein